MSAICARRSSRHCRSLDLPVARMTTSSSSVDFFFMYRLQGVARAFLAPVPGWEALGFLGFGSLALDFAGFEGSGFSGSLSIAIGGSSSRSSSSPSSAVSSSQSSSFKLFLLQQPFKIFGLDVPLSRIPRMISKSFATLGSCATIGEYKSDRISKFQTGVHYHTLNYNGDPTAYIGSYL